VFTLTELREFDATDPTKPVYLAVKGVVFDVTRRREMYAPGRGYSVFAGRDASKVCVRLAEGLV
jgi:predicted heme/steroid binding protein